MGNTLNNKKANGLALLPFLVFIVVYMGPFQRLRLLGLCRGEPAHQIGDAVTHHALDGLYGVLRPAVFPADGVGGGRQIPDGIQQRAVQIKNHCAIHV